MATCFLECKVSPQACDVVLWPLPFSRTVVHVVLSELESSFKAMLANWQPEWTLAAFASLYLGTELSAMGWLTRLSRRPSGQTCISTDLNCTCVEWACAAKKQELRKLYKA